MDKVRLTMDVESDPLRMNAVVLDRNQVIEREMKRLLEMVVRGYMDEEAGMRNLIGRRLRVWFVDDDENHDGYVFDLVTVLKMGETSE